jgi:long chain fatty acid CoA FadD26
MPTHIGTLPDEYAGLRLSGPFTPRLPAELLAHWAATRPDAIVHEFVDYLADRKGIRRTYTWSEWDAWCRAVAGRMQRLAGRDCRVAILAPQGPEYVAAFHAGLRAGVVSVPLFAPDLPGHGDRLVAVLRDCNPEVVVTTPAKRDLVADLLASLGMAGVAVLVVEVPAEMRDDAAGFVPPGDLDLDELAYLQYTSGSTRAPAGVELTHRNLVANLWQVAQGHGVEHLPPEATTVSWLPLFHDMGLLLGAGASAVLGVKTALMDPLAFVLKPARWMAELARHPNAASAAPNFAYALAAKKARADDVAALDLSGVLFLINGAEPVLPATLEAFERTFAPAGLPATAQRPSYGLAEATLQVSVGDPTSPRTTLHADVSALQRGELTPAAPGGRGTTLVAAGRPFGMRVAVTDPDARVPLPDGQVGEIWIQGPNVGRGYWGRPAESAETFGARLVSADGTDLPAGPWLRTGDLGALLDGHLYITGRRKDLIIVDGRNIYPHDVEATVEQAHDHIALHRLAAFSVPAPDGESVVVVAERYRLAADSGAHLDDITAAVRRAVSEEHAISLADVVLVEPDTIPWTSSGKIARAATRRSYLDGTLTRVPAASAAASPMTSST